MTIKTKPELSFLHIWNMCFGFLGIQFGFALQNANVSRIFQTLGAEVDEIPILWVAAPLTGLIVQPIIGYLSDNCRSRFGRRRPFFFIGAVLTTMALLFMPNSPSLWIAAGMLWIMDASINITMEPFRAFVGDMLPEKQRPLGYVTQSFFIGIGAVVASALPWMLTQWFGVANTAAEGQIPPSVKIAFYAGAAILFLAVMWTVFTTKEYTTEQLAEFHGQNDVSTDQRDHAFGQFKLWWLLSGGIATVLIYALGWKHELYIISVGFLVYGVFLYIAARMQGQNKKDNGFFHVIYDLNHMPPVMKQLSVIQFFSWFALFSMWIYSTSAITTYHFGAEDVSSQLYNDGADWVGVLFGAYNGFAALAAFFIASMANKWGAPKAHAACLLLGAGSFVSFLLIKNPYWLLLPMVGIGFAWASILSLPYAMLANTIPQNKMGLYMGIFNFFIVIPQLLAASVLGLIVKYVFAGNAVFAYLIGAAFWVIAAVFTLRINLEE